MRDARQLFTLVELLVVTVIIAILASMLLPALSDAKDASKAADCRNNQRQVYLAFAMFADDNDDRFPFTYYWWRTLGNAGYLGSGEIHGGVTTPGPSGWAYTERRWPSFQCVAEQGEVFGTADNNCRQPNPVTTAYDSDLDHCSYAMNWSINHYNYYVGYGCTTSSRQGFSGTWFFNSGAGGGPERASLIMDKHKPGWGWVANYFEWNVDNPTYYLGGNQWWYAFRHPGGNANILFLDGHVSKNRHVNLGGAANWIKIWDLPPPGGPACP